MAAEVYRVQRNQPDPMARALKILQIGAAGSDIAAKAGAPSTTTAPNGADLTMNEDPQGQSSGAPLQISGTNNAMKRRYLSSGGLA